MFGHIPELLIVLGIALIIFGPEKLPEVAASTGKMYRELRQAMDDALHPEDTRLPDDFETYYHESLRRAGEDVPPVETEIDLGQLRTYREEEEESEGTAPFDSTV